MRHILAAVFVLALLPLGVAAQEPVKPGFSGRVPGLAAPARLRMAPTIDLHGSLAAAIVAAPGLTPTQRNALRATPPPLLIEQANNPILPAAALRPYLATPANQAGPTAGHPAVALLLHDTGDGGAFEPTCTGTLVSADQVITAAHCLCPPPNYPDWRTCLGNAAKSALADPARLLVFFQHAGSRRVTAVNVDDTYGFATANNFVTGDIALLQLDSPVTWIGPAPLPASTPPQFGVDAGMFAAGFGWSATTRARAILQRSTAAGLKTAGPVTPAECGDLGDPIYPAQICIRYAAGGDSGLCGGDSGGPLWSAAGPLQFATASAGKIGEDPCLEPFSGQQATQVAMNLAFEGHRSWLGKLLHVGAPRKPFWPPFGDNLANRLTPASLGYFEANGRYTGGWVRPPPGTLLVTINSPFPIRSMQVQLRSGRIACRGRLNGERGSYVNWCTVEVRAPRQQFRLVAIGTQTLPGNVEAQPFQYVIAGLPPGTIKSKVR